ncbi:hypothetical protein [Acinetobacter guillouiae]|uniref:hypothetical protein n=1 Tax=Acinetobacter guillouiae TaxID=106649 RepID=UPI001AE94407|nr:hypothetical protein [Acinetobacter guillouiae]MBP2544849.1 hypothetical protein [Acinetobacter guillouiae]
MKGYILHSSVIAYYKPQKDQTFRCSSNFPHWNTPKADGAKLKFQVIIPEGYPQPHFSITHDKVGPDKTWYTNVYDGKEILVKSEQGEGGGHALYVGTTSQLPAGLRGDQTYAVLVWVSE